MQGFSLGLHSHTQDIDGKLREAKCKFRLYNRFMAAKTKAQRENLSLFEDDRQTDSPDDIQLEDTAPKEILLSSSDPEARELFDLSTQVKDLKPWRWMEETDLIGIENPETGEI